MDTTSHIYEACFTRTPFQLLSGEGWKRLVSLRIDETGVLLGGAPARYRSQTDFVPWSDITAVVIWQQRTMGGSINHVGLRRRPEAPALAGHNKNMRPEQTAKLAPHVEHELFLASRPVNYWRLEIERLEAAVDAFGDDVPVLVYKQLYL